MLLVIAPLSWCVCAPGHEMFDEVIVEARADACFTEAIRGAEEAVHAELGIRIKLCEEAFELGCVTEAEELLEIEDEDAA